MQQEDFFFFASVFAKWLHSLKGEVRGGQTISFISRVMGRVEDTSCQPRNSQYLTLKSSLRTSTFYHPPPLQIHWFLEGGGGCTQAA